ncbi:AAEL014629-PA, partial [Aedes aegypti]
VLDSATLHPSSAGRTARMRLRESESQKAAVCVGKKHRVRHGVLFVKSFWRRSFKIFHKFQNFCDENPPLAIAFSIPQQQPWGTPFRQLN